MESQPIQVTSHVARDFLQNAAYFNTTPKLIWEYVANSLDAAINGLPVIVAVEITGDCARVSDNGRGMSRTELSSFFQMHGHNIQRERGKRVRGRFGTGKCAAFGLANLLRIDTTQGGLRNVVELRRHDIEQADSGDPFPVREMVVDEPTEEQDGTVVEIREFNITRPRIPQVISYVERHLSRYRQRARVTINGHECDFQEPPFVEEFERYPPPAVAGHIGHVPLIVKVSPIPLEDGLRGIDVLAYGIWHATTLAGLEKKEYADHLFGQIDVPILEDGTWPIPAFDNTRNNQLNPENPVVGVLLDWLSQELDHIRLRTLERERERRNSETNQRLVKEARMISRILNEDFAQQELELELARRVARRSSGRSISDILFEQTSLRSDGAVTYTEQDDLAPMIDGSPVHWEPLEPQPTLDRESTLLDEFVLEMSVESETAQLGQDGGAMDSGAPASIVTDTDPLESLPLRSLNPEPEQDDTPEPSKRRRPVFRIEFENVTSDSPRSRYDSDLKTIFINLDNPKVAGAFEAWTQRSDAKKFLETCYEVVAVEYALAIPHEKLEEGELTDVSDALFEVRDTINRMTRRFSKIMEP